MSGGLKRENVTRNSGVNIVEVINAQEDMLLNVASLSSVPPRVQLKPGVSIPIASSAGLA